MSEAEAFEKALQANPDDLAGWCAYADYLVEHDDPRGEFMQVQIALEDEARPKLEREALKKRERALLKKHQREWLGELAPYTEYSTAQQAMELLTLEFARGWLSELVCRSLTVAQARALARSPEAKMLRRLIVEDVATEAPAGTRHQYIDAYFEPGPDIPAGVDPSAAPALHSLLHAPHLAGVRVFGLGGPATIADGQDGYYDSARVNGELTDELVARMPRIEELYLRAYSVPAAEVFALPMPRLRVLLYDHADHYPLEVLAANPSLGNLTHLHCYPHAQRPDDPDAYIRLDQLRAICRSPHLGSLSQLHLLLTDFGDEGVEEVITSGLLARLRVLDLSLGCVTDRGAALLAARPELKNLELLNLASNALEKEGIALLEATGVLVSTHAQHGEHPSRLGPDGYLEYLSYGDME
jgi:uncharacterized protein (TIGR02996 family)